MSRGPTWDPQTIHMGPTWNQHTIYVGPTYYLRGTYVLFKRDPRTMVGGTHNSIEWVTLSF